MSTKDNLQDIRRQVDMYFDQALNSQESQNLLDMVNSDPTYHQVFNQEKTIRDTLKQSVQRPPVTPDLIQNIKNNIRMA